jgi:hypothetical protein
MPKNHLVILCVLIGLTGCGPEPQKRVYQEIVIESPQTAVWSGTGDPHAGLQGNMPNMPAETPMPQSVIPEGLLNSKTDVPLTWEKPGPWQEFPGSGFRVVTFKAGEGDDAIECSIVSLSGAAGGVEANLIRWMTQINLKAPSDDLLEFLKKEGAYLPGDTWQLIDFTKLQKDLPPTTPSMYVNILQLPDSTVFV